MALSLSRENASVIFKRLNGLVCLYKPPDVSVQYLIREFGERLCCDLNKLKMTPVMNYLDIEKSENGEFVVDIRPSYSENVLATGPKYTDENISLNLSPIGKRSSGVCIIGVNEGIAWIKKWKRHNPLKVFHVNGTLGLATRYFYKDDKIVAKGKYERITKATMDKYLTSFQAAHQRKIFSDLGIDIQSQQAYDFAVNGLLRPPPGSIPCIYSMKCVHFKSPDFTLEISCVNDNENYTLRLVHDLGLQLKCFAHCTGIRCIRLGPFTIDNALIVPQFSLNNILENLQKCKELSKKYFTPVYPPYLKPKSESVSHNQVKER